MAQDPYKAPAAPVGKREATEDAAPRPPQVTLACRILWVTLVLGAATMHPSVRGEWWAEGAEGDAGLADAALIGGLFLAVVFLAIFAVLLFLTGRRENWARWTMLGLLAFGWLMGLYDLPRSFAATPGAALTDMLIAAAELWASYLLFLSPGAAWFKR
jgi:hypothetical protein